MHLRRLTPHLLRFCTRTNPVLLVKKHTAHSQLHGICEWVLNRPEVKNALSLEIIRLLEESVEECNEDNELRCLLVQSSSPGVFCAGADLKERKNMTIQEAANTVKRLRSVFHNLSKLRIPSIAILDGVALGGGAELALACDIRIGSHSTRFAFPETRLGIIPGAGGTQRLPRLIGPSKAKELIFTGRSVEAEECFKLGLLDSLSEDPMDAALQLAKQICSAGPIGVQMAKQAIDEGLSQDLSGGLKVESNCYERTLMTEDRLEGLRAFSEKRKPNFKGV